MMLVMKPLKIFALSLKGRIAWKPLSPEELPAVSVVKAFNDAISPWFPDGDKNRCNTVEKAKSDYLAKGSRKSVAATKTQLVVQLQEVRHTYRLPTSHQSGGGVLVALGSLRFNVNTMAA
jgi:hypothetical protein